MLLEVKLNSKELKKNRKLQVQVGHLQVEKDIHSHGFGWSVRFNQNRGCRS